jgi:hypothetical protein
MNLQNKSSSGDPAGGTARKGRLADKVAVITGAASGIGKEIALEGSFSISDRAISALSIPIVSGFKLLGSPRT